MPSRKETKEKTRAALLAAGAELFAEQGLDGPSLDAICERAGFTRGAFYVHFKDREDFLAAVMEDLGGPLLDTIFAGEEADLMQTFVHFAAAFKDGRYPLGPGGSVHPHQLLDACKRSPRIRDRYIALIEESVRRLTQVVERSQEGRSVRPDVDAQATATLLLLSVIGAHTLTDLGAPFDFQRTGMTLLQTLSPRRR